MLYKTLSDKNDPKELHRHEDRLRKRLKKLGLLCQKGNVRVRGYSSSAAHLSEDIRFGVWTRMMLNLGRSTILPWTKLKRSAKPD